MKSRYPKRLFGIFCVKIQEKGKLSLHYESNDPLNGGALQADVVSQSKESRPKKCSIRSLV